MPKIASDAICEWGFIFFKYFASFVNIKRLLTNLIKQVVDKVYFQLLSVQLFRKNHIQSM